MSAPIRLRALEALAEVMNRLVPELQGHAQAGAVDAPDRMGWPNLAVLGTRWGYEPTQDGTIHALLPPTKAVFDVGRITCTMKLQLGSKTMRERARLEHGINQLFLSQRGHPGVLTLRLNDCWGALVSYELDDTGWEDNEAMAKQWWANIALGCTAPALVERGGLYDIDQLIIGGVAPVAPPADSTWLAEVVTIAEDGSYTVGQP